MTINQLPLAGKEQTRLHSTPGSASGFGLQVSEYPLYRLVIFPEGEAGARIREMSNNLKINKPVKLEILEKPFIRLAEFEARERMEETLIRWIQRVCNSHNRFTVQLNNFGSHPHHCLFLRIMNPDHLLKLVKELQVVENYIVSNGSGYLKWTKKPICSLTNGEVQSNWTEYIRTELEKDFFDAITVYNLVLVKSPGENNGTEEIVNVFPLYP